MSDYRTATHTEIRQSLGHGDGNRRVKISRADRVTYYGSTDDTDRSQDFWHDAGRTSDYCYDESLGEARP